jgi:hypothetical protein
VHIPLVHRIWSRLGLVRLTHTNLIVSSELSTSIRLALFGRGTLGIAATLTKRTTSQ